MTIDNYEGVITMKRIALVLLAIAIAIPAFAQVENVKVGGDVAVTMVYRDFEAILQASDDATDFFLAQTRVGVSATLANKVSAMIRLISEKQFAEDAALGIGLDLAYLKVDDLLLSGLSLTVGRQEIQYGDGFLVGSQYSSWYGNPSGVAFDLSLQKAFDAIKVDYAVKGAPVSLSFTDAKLIEEAKAGDGENLYVLALAYKAKNFSIEPYFVWDKYYEENYQAGAVLAKAMLGGFDLSGEVAIGFGDADGWAVNVGGLYAFKGAMKPALSFGVAWFSEDWWDFYPTGGADRIGKVAYALAGNDADHDSTEIRVGLSVMPSPKLDLGLNVFGLADSGFDNFGYEGDLSLGHAVTKDLKLGVDLGYFSPNVGDASWEALVSMKVGF